jgi:hypothetical protein
MSGEAKTVEAAQESAIKLLEKEVEALQEMLFGVMVHLENPIVLDLQRIRDAIVAGGVTLDASLDKEKDTLTISIIPLEDLAHA